MYPAEALTGTGSISGYAVRCISAKWMVKFHSGYELTESRVTRAARRAALDFELALPVDFVLFAAAHQ